MDSCDNMASLEKRCDLVIFVCRLLMAGPYIFFCILFLSDAKDCYLQCLVHKQGDYALLYGTDPTEIWAYLQGAMIVIAWLLLGVLLIIKQAVSPKNMPLKIHTGITVALVYWSVLPPLLAALGLNGY